MYVLMCVQWHDRQLRTEAERKTMDHKRRNWIEVWRQWRTTFCELPINTGLLALREVLWGKEKDDPEFSRACQKPPKQRQAQRKKHSKYLHSLSYLDIVLTRIVDPTACIKWNNRRIFNFTTYFEVYSRFRHILKTWQPWLLYNILTVETYLLAE